MHSLQERLNLRICIQRLDRSRSSLSLVRQILLPRLQLCQGTPSQARTAVACIMTDHQNCPDLPLSEALLPHDVATGKFEKMNQGAPGADIAVPEVLITRSEWATLKSQAAMFVKLLLWATPAEGKPSLVLADDDVILMRCMSLQRSR